MRVVSIHVLSKNGQKAVFLRSAYELSSVGFLKRKFAREMIDFGARTSVERVQEGAMTRIESEDMEELAVWAYVDKSGVAAVLITDREYPQSAAKIALSKVVKEFNRAFPAFDPRAAPADQALPFPALDEMLARFQDPREADKLLKVEQDLNEIHEILQKTMKDMLQRGEDLEQLMKQSEDISALAYQFHDKSKKANTRCCSIY